MVISVTPVLPALRVTPMSELLSVPVGITATDVDNSPPSTDNGTSMANGEPGPATNDPWR